MDDIERENIKQMATISERLKNLTSEVRQGFEKIEQSYVRKDEFDPIREKVDQIQIDRDRETREREDFLTGVVGYFVKIIIPVILGSATIAAVIFELLG